MARRRRLARYALLGAVAAVVLLVLAPKNTMCTAEVGAECPWLTGREPVVYPLSGLLLIGVIALVAELLVRRRQRQTA
jgi:hypothetical protein